MKTIGWTTRSGIAASITVELQTKEIRHLDGLTVEVDALKIITRAYVDGKDVGLGWIRKNNDPVYCWRYAVLGFTQEIHDRIQAAIAELKTAPEWIANEELIATNAAECADYDALVATIDRQNHGTY